MVNSFSYRRRGRRGKISSSAVPSKIEPVRNETGLFLWFFRCRLLPVSALAQPPLLSYVIFWFSDARYSGLQFLLYLMQTGLMFSEKAFPFLQLRRDCFIFCRNVCFQSVCFLFCVPGKDHPSYLLQSFVFRIRSGLAGGIPYVYLKRFRPVFLFWKSERLHLAAQSLFFFRIASL